MQQPTVLLFFCMQHVALLSIIPFWFVPGHEGKIGMAAIRLKDGCPFDGKKLFIHTKDYLPSYAIPRFIRIQVRNWIDLCSCLPLEKITQNHIPQHFKV